MRKHLVMIGLPLLLGGCGLPPAISVASWAIDGISYMASGKSVTDHALSEVMQQDCALFRAVQERNICSDFTIDTEGGPSILVAAAPHGDNWDVEDGVPQRADQLAVPVEIAAFASGFGPGDVSPAIHDPLPHPAVVAASWSPGANAVSKPGRFDAAAPKDRPAYLTTPVHVVAAVSYDVPSARRTVSARTLSVVGSFQSAANASRLASRFASLEADVLTLEVDGRTWHRVVVDAPLAQVQRMGVVDAWTLRVCTPDGGIPPCDADRPLHAADRFAQVAQLN